MFGRLLWFDLPCQQNPTCAVPQTAWGPQVSVIISRYAQPTKMKFGGTHASVPGSSGMGMASKSDEFKYARMEAGLPEQLYPGATPTENMLRLGFIR